MTGIYMQYEGIDGDVTTQEYNKWISIRSMEFCVSRGVSMAAGHTANRGHGTPTFGEVKIVHVMDKASLGLLQATVSGTTGKKVIIHLVEVDAKQIKDYVTYELTNTLVSSYHMSSDGGIPVELISLSYTKLQVAYTAKDAANKAATPVRFMYNLESASTC